MANIVSRCNAIISGCKRAQKGGIKPCYSCPHYEHPTWESPGGCTCEVDDDSELPCMNGKLEQEAEDQLHDYEEWKKYER